MPKFEYVDVPGGTDRPDFGPIPLEKLEHRILSGDVEAAKALDAKTLERIMQGTQQQAVAAIILDIGDTELLRILMGKYRHGHQGDDWLKKHREKGMQELIEKLKRTAEF